MQEPLVSIIMSTKDTEDNMLKSAIYSILYQTYKNFEFIIICDGSDKNLKILEQIVDKRITIIKHEISIGLTKSLNEALKIVKGKYIARIDSDDISIKDRLKIQVEFLEKNKDIDICSTFAQYIGDRHGFSIDLFNKPKQKKAELFIYNNIIHSGIMIRKQFLINNNLEYDENYKYAQDYELWSRCCKISNIKVIPKVCIKYRVHKLQISTGKRKEQNELCRNIFKRNLIEMNLKDINSKVDMVFFLSKKSEKKYENIEIERFIDEIIVQNKIYKIYDEKSLKHILYYRYFVVKYKELELYKKLLLLFKFNAFKLVIVKVFYIMKFKILQKNWDCNV